MQFATGFISDDHFKYQSTNLRGRNWQIRFVASTNKDFGYQAGNRIDAPKEMVIVAKTEAIARGVVTDIMGAIALLDGQPVPIDGQPVPINAAWSLPFADNPASKIKRLHAGRALYGDLPVACRIAVRASHRRCLRYALAKYRLSTEAASFEWSDLAPNASETIPRWNDPVDHVRLATAILLEYSVIEELGLEVRASQSNPSKIGKQWNPVVKSELEERLKRAGVDISAPVVWIIRGSKTNLEDKRPEHLFATGTRTPWTRGDIRDRHVDVVDAIAHASFLRSKVSSHRLIPDLVRLLSAYDVANVQHLARRLFLVRLGYWPPWKMLKEKYQRKFG